MSARSCGWAMLCGSSTQEAADFAAISHAATLGIPHSLHELLRRVPHVP